MQLRDLRVHAGLTQAQLAARAGVSRQLVGAVEAGRHLPRVDAALALATALGVDVAALFSTSEPAVDALSGAVPQDGAMVRRGLIGDRVVTANVRTGSDGWGVADAVVEDGRLAMLASLGPGIVVAGCEPGLQVLEQRLRDAGMGAVAVSASSAAAKEALSAGRLHAAVVHGPEPQPADLGQEILRFGLARWQVGLAAPDPVAEGWWRQALTGAVPVVQRAPGAGVQRTFEDSLASPDTRVPGPLADGHLDAVRRSLLTGMPAVTIEPAAIALRAVFHPLDVHVVELWVAREWLAARVVTEALDVLASRRFRRRLSAVGGYDLADCGVRVT